MEIVSVCAVCGADWMGDQTAHAESCANQREGWGFTVPKEFKAATAKCNGVTSHAFDHRATALHTGMRCLCGRTEVWWNVDQWCCRDVPEVMS